MRQVVQNYRTGELKIEEMAEPTLRRGGILVRTGYSLVSSGTEGTAVREASMSLVDKARARPDQVKKVMETLRAQGLLATYRAVMNRLDSLTPLGYSAAGTVIGVGEGADEFAEGQLVACGGVGYANHAEVNWVPRNLAVPVPEGVSLAEAACATVGSVAMQAFRQSEAAVGDTVAVIGLGLVGQLYLQIARAAGCRTVGMDIDDAKLRLAQAMGADLVCSADPAVAAAAVERASDGLGADVVVLAVGAASNDPLELAVRLARDRGRIVNVGKTRIDVPYEAFFRKDLTLVFSRSYGPGRYDPNYEEKGQDYPAGYVKWTERRNIAAFLDLVARGQLNLAPIVARPVPFREAEAAYARLRSGAAGLAILFEYPEVHEAGPTVIDIPRRKPPRGGSVVLGCIGAGSYANTKLLPLLAGRKDVRLKTVTTTRGTSARTAAERFGFERAGTDHAAVLGDAEINAVLIATPHASHAELVAGALAAGKSVFVEKPLAISEEQLAKVREAIEAGGNTRLQVGFNRRFAPLAVSVRDHFRDITAPRTLLMRVNAGFLAAGKWVSDPTQSGGRMVGEGCHFVDLASFIIGEDPEMAHAMRAGLDSDNVSVQVRYPGGSTATIVYFPSGSPLVPKEYIEVHGGGFTAVIDDFRSATLYGRKPVRLGGGTQDKGQSGEMAAFCEAVRTGGPLPIPIESLFATTDATLKAVKSLRTGRNEPLERWVFATEEEPPVVGG